MIRTACLCFQIAILVFVGVWLANEPGTVTIVWREWRVDAQIGIFVLLIFSQVVLAVMVFWSWRILRHGPTRLLSSHRLGRERKGYRELTQGMISLASGEAEEALRHAYKAGSLLNEPIAGHLLIAEAAKLQGKAALAKEHFEAMCQSSDATLAGLRGLFEQAILEEDSTNALKLGAKIRELKQGSAWLLPKLFRLKVGARDWEGADEVLLDAMRRKAISADEGKRDRAFVLFERGKSALYKGDSATAIGFMREANDLHPGFEAAAVEYARLLGAGGKQRRALRVLEQAWSRGGAFKSIAEEYIRLQQAENSVEEYQQIQKLSTTVKNNSDALLILSDFALKARLWGETRRHLEALLQDQPSASTYTMLAELEDAEKDDMAAADHWRRARNSAIGDKVWICSNCRGQSAKWSSYCDSCDAFGSLEWRHPDVVPSALQSDQERAVKLIEKPGAISA